MCSGKIYFDLIEAREKAKEDKIVIYQNRATISFSGKTTWKTVKKI